MSANQTEYVPLRKRTRDASIDQISKNDDKKVMNNLLNDLNTQIDGNLKTYLKSNENLKRSTLKDSKAVDFPDNSNPQKSNFNKLVTQTNKNGKIQTTLNISIPFLKNNWVKHMA